MNDNAPLPAEKLASPAVQFREQFGRMTSELASALPPHIPPERFVRVVLTAVNANPDLLRADRRPLMESAMKAAQDGLLPDGRDGAFVVYRSKAKSQNGERDSWIDKVQWQPMVGGILKKIRNSGELRSISATVVHERDSFHLVQGDDERIEHTPCLDADRGPPRLVYAIARTRDGGVYREVMTVREVEQVRQVSRARDSGPWRDWWPEMARKTVIRRLAKRLPMSSDLDDLLRRDDALYDFDRSRRDFRRLPNPLAEGGAGLVRAAGTLTSELPGTGATVDLDAVSEAELASVASAPAVSKQSPEEDA